MKKIILSITLLASATVFGQTKGSWYIGGSGGFSKKTNRSGTTNTITETKWSFSPEAGTFVTDHLQLGFGFVSAGTATNTNQLAVKSSQFGGLIYGRYLFGNWAFKPFLGLNVSYQVGELRSRSLVTGEHFANENTYTFNTNLNAGFAYSLSPRVSIFGSIGVLGFSNNVVISENYPTYTFNDLGLNVNTTGNRFTIGMYYTICKGKA